MTRRLRPPVPIGMRCHADGTPARLRRGGRERTVTRVAAAWVRPAAWWRDEDDRLAGERAYYRIVTDGVAAYEVFRSEEGAWYLERVID